MSDNVIELGKSSEPEILCLVCECGCETFHALSNKTLECAACGETLDDNISGYAPSEIKAVSKPALTSERVIFDSEDFAFRSVLAKAVKGETCALIVMNKAGNQHVWNEIPETDDQKKWYLENLEIAKKTILGDGE